MKLPYAYEMQKDAEMISIFGGLDRNIQISENCFSEMKNMTGDSYPLLSARSARGETTLPEGITALEICNTYLTKADREEGEITEDVFAIVTESEDGEAVLSLYKKGVYEGGPGTVIGGEAVGTSLIAQAGYVYAFPQGYRKACYSGGVSGPLSNVTVTRRAFKVDSEGFPGGAAFTMRPCSSDGIADGGAFSSYTATKIYDGSDTSVIRASGDLIIITASGLSVNEWGTTVLVDKNGKITEKYYGRAEKIEIPDGGFALTGINAPGTWLYNNATEGCYIAVNGMNVSVYASGENSVVYEKPETPFNGLKWYDKATGAKYVYSTAQGEWIAYATNYILLTYSESGSAGDREYLFDVLYNGEIRLDADGKELHAPFEGFKEGDSIKIKGFSKEQDGSYVIAALANGGLVLNGTIDDIVTCYLDETDDDEHSKAFTISRAVPKMDFVIECNNRLWGCYYGINDEGKVINEIYASALGDPTNWYRYQGISTDSWTATVGADGPFTGAIQYGGYPLFFKENCIIRVYGTSPSSFQTASYNYRGVQKGSHRSLSVCDEILYYLSSDGVMAYNGSVPQKVSDALGSESYKDGVGGSIGSKYYLSCLDSSDNVHLFVFNARYGFWHREDDLRVDQFLRHKAELYMLTGGKIITAAGDGERVYFEATTGEWGLSNPYKKHFNNFIIRAAVPFGESLSVYISYDGGEFSPINTYYGRGNAVQQIKITPVRCERVRLKFKGSGDTKIISIYREITEGGKDVL